jgi:tripartite-type tricarboxylate transporter receptor subunit TctC
MKPTLSRRNALIGLCALGAATVLPASAQSGDYPNRPVTLIVSFPPGGSSDFFTRLTARELSQAWGKPVVVENKPGAGGNIGAVAAARAQPDGYTLFMSSIATHGINASLYKSLGYDPVKDFAPVTKIATVPNVLVVHPSVPATTVKEYMAWVNADAKNAFYASSGVGTSPHLSTELLKAMTGLQLSHVPYKGSAPALADVVGGQVPMAIDNLPAAINLIKAGRLRALVVTSPTRSIDLPDVPTMIESGVPSYDVTSWWGLFVPAGTPEAIVRKINADLVKALGSPTMRAAIEKQGAAAAPSTPAELAALVTSETARWGKVIRERGITGD